MTPVEWSRVTTPMRVEEWEEALRTHPDRTYVSYLMRGLSQGFHIGFEYGAKNVQTSLKEHEIGGGQPSSG